MSVIDTTDAARLNQLRERLEAGQLPGFSAQARMGHALRQDYREAPSSVRHAAVLALLYPLVDRLQLLFIQRTSPPGDRHGGQISFPGGAYEADDRDARHTALREAEEEVGVAAGQVEILGEMTSLYIPVSNFLVKPFVGFTTQRPKFVPEASEVARIIELPFGDFFGERVTELRDKQLFNGMLLKDVPHWTVGGEAIWGATAMMVSELVSLTR